MGTNSGQSQLNLRRLLPLLLIIAVAIAVFVLFREQLSWQALAEHRLALLEWRDSHYIYLSILFVLAYFLIVAFSLPGATAATLAGGFLFGLFPGVLYNVAAATMGAIVIFLAARMGLGDYLSSKIDSSSGVVKKMSEKLKENELSVLFLLRLVPIVPFFAANLIPALVGVKLKNFVLTTSLGIIPGAAIYTWVGTGLGAAIEAGQDPNLGIIWQWNILGPLLGLASLACLPILIKAFRRKGEENDF